MSDFERSIESMGDDRALAIVAILGEAAPAVAVEIFQVVARGEQPDEAALPLDGALRGDIPLSGTERSEG